MQSANDGLGTNGPKAILALGTWEHEIVTLYVSLPEVLGSPGPGAL